MKVRVELDQGETLEKADQLLEKALKSKHECSGGERYADDYLNELEKFIVDENSRILDQISSQVIEMVSNAK